MPTGRRISVLILATLRLPAAGINEPELERRVSANLENVQVLAKFLKHYLSREERKKGRCGRRSDATKRAIACCGVGGLRAEGQLPEAYL